MGFDQKLWRFWLAAELWMGFCAIVRTLGVDKDLHLLSFIIFLSCPVWVLIRGDYTVSWSQHTEYGKSD